MLVSSIPDPTVTRSSARELVVAPGMAQTTDQLPCVTGTVAPTLIYATHHHPQWAMTPASGRRETDA